MQKNLWTKIKEYVKKNRNRKAWQKLVLILGCIVVFCTTYALILPAITMEQKAYCGHTEHIHTKECYRLIEVPSELICNLVEAEEVSREQIPMSSVSDSDAEEYITIHPHTHTEDCYGVPEQPPLTCVLEEGEEHAHDFLCYGTWELVCTEEEHKHSLICFSNPEADVETEQVWETAIKNLNLSGTWEKDLVTIAKSQLGYKESILNYAVDENDNMLGYTRYGAWAGAPYTEWNSTFADFCIYYTGAVDMPVNTDCGQWVEALISRQLYYNATDYAPMAGNLMFMDKDGDGKADSVSIVSEVKEATEVEAAKVCAVAGDVDGQVQYISYDLAEVSILGYGVLPKQPAPYFAYTDSRVQVEVVLPEDSQVPRNAQLVVTPIGQENGSYTGLVEQAQQVVEGEIARIQLYDISFYTRNQEYIPVNDRAKVTLRMAENMTPDNMVVLHYEETEEAPVIIKDDSTEQQVIVSATTNTFSAEPAENMNTVVSFETEGFSTFAVVEVVSGIYEAEVLDVHYSFRGTIGASGKTYMIFSYRDIKDDALDSDADTRVALKAETITVQEKDLTAGEDASYRTVSRLKGEEVVYENYGQVINDRRGTITAVRDDGLLWRFAQSDGDTFTIQSVSTNQYLSINGSGNLELSNTPYQFVSRAMYGDTNPGICFKSASGNNYVAFFDPLQRINKENQHVFAATTVEGSMSDINANSPPYEIKMTLAEFNNGTENTGVEAERVTNLAGKILSIIAVNNDGNPNIVYPAMGSENLSYAPSHLVGIDLYSASTNGGNLYIGDEYDDANRQLSRIAWEFEPAEVPGTYYIKVANIYEQSSETPVKQNNQYLNISASALSISENKQPIEVVKTNVISGTGTQVSNNVVVLRTMIEGTYYTVQLDQNIGTNNFCAGTNADLTYRANQMVLADISDQGPAQFKAWIDELPVTADFDAATKLAGTTFEEQVAYRKRMREIAMNAKAYYDNNWNSLTAVQKNFIGEKRIDKLLKDLAWLWRKDPGVVTPAAPNAKVKVFNYDRTVNDHALATNNYFQFFSWDSSEKSVNGQQNDNNILKRIEMSPVLGANGFPEIVGGYRRVDERDDGNNIINTYYEYVPVEGGELNYLFQAPYQVGSEMEGGGGLFQVDADGNYFYYSDRNAAWYDKDANQFVLYDTVVRPEYTRMEYGVPNSETNDSRSNFFPFNEVAGNVIYDYPGGLDETTVKTQYDNHTAIETDTAYLNAPIDLWFGMSIEYDFFIPKDGQVDGEDMVFKFHGDDDVFVYVDDVLVLNIGGTHEARSGSINFTTGEVTYQNVAGNLDQGLEGKVDADGNLLTVTETTTIAELYREAGKDNIAMDNDTLADYTMHNLKFFYMERGGTYSYAGIEFNMPPVPEDTLEVSKEISTEEGVSVIDANLNYTFRVRSVLNNSVTEELFVAPGATYHVYKNDELVRMDTVKEGGLITLKAGEKAVFYNISGTTKQFVVEEMMPTRIAEQYDLKFRNYAGLEVEPNDTYEENGFMVYQTPIYTLGASQDSQDIYWSVICDNVVDSSQLDTLKITKREGEGTDISEDKEFQIKVQVGNDAGDLIPLPQGTEYKVLLENGTEDVRRVENASGMITLKAGETATIQGFLAGTYWLITEDLSGLGENEHYTPFYSMKVNNSNEMSGNSGTFELKDTIEFFVSNYGCDFLVDIPVSKQTIGNTGNSSFTFEVESGSWNQESNTWTKERTWNPVSITVQDGNLVEQVMRVGGYVTESKDTYFYKIYERKDSGSFVYDETFYIIEVHASENEGDIGNDDHSFTTEIVNVWKNGTESINRNEAIPFVNYKATSLTVEKEVMNSLDPNYTDEREFIFEATVQREGGVFKGINAPDDDSYSVDEDGKIHFSLKHGESVTILVPVDATVTIAEIFSEGYETDYRITTNSTPGDWKSGLTTETISMNGDMITVTYMNRTGYQLPATGGMGTHWYLLGGLLLSFVAGGLLLLKKKAYAEEGK